MLWFSCMSQASLPLVFVHVSQASLPFESRNDLKTDVVRAGWSDLEPTTKRPIPMPSIKVVFMGGCESHVVATLSTNISLIAILFFMVSVSCFFLVLVILRSYFLQRGARLLFFREFQCCFHPSCVAAQQVGHSSCGFLADYFHIEIKLHQNQCELDFQGESTNSWTLTC